MVQEGSKEQQVEEAQSLLRRSFRVSRAPNCYVPTLDYVMLIDCKEPSCCYNESMLRDDKLKWK